MYVSNNILAILLIAIFFCAGWWSIKITDRQVEIMQRQAMLSRSVEDVSYQVAALSSDICNLGAIENREKAKKGDR